MSKTFKLDIIWLLLGLSTSVGVWTSVNGYYAGKHAADRWYAQHWLPMPKLEIRGQEDDGTKVIWRRDPNQSRIFDATIYMKDNVVEPKAEKQK